MSTEDEVLREIQRKNTLAARSMAALIWWDNADEVLRVRLPSKVEVAFDYHSDLASLRTIIASATAYTGTNDNMPAPKEAKSNLTLEELLDL